jgi:ribosomal protein S18 acetylase RimI-like enzyme
MIRLLEELSNNALPSTHALQYDGWLLRFGDSTARRANSVCALYPSSLPLDEKIAYCEDVYARRNRRIVFKLTDDAQPPDLESVLLAGGYHADQRSSVQTLPINVSDAWMADKSDLLKMTFTNRVTAQWMDEQIAFHDESDRPRLTTRSMYDLILPHAAYFRLSFDGVPAASGLGVIERGWIGLYNIVVEPSIRGRGVGQQLVQRILAYGAAFGAHSAYLQVMTTNTPACALYHKIGFREAYRYWYVQK